MTDSQRAKPVRLRTVHGFADMIGAVALSARETVVGIAFDDAARPAGTWTVPQSIERFREEIARFDRGVHVLERAGREELVFELDELGELGDEELVDAGEFADALDRPAHLERVADVVHASLAGHAELPGELVFADGPLDGLAVGGAPVFAASVLEPQHQVLYIVYGWI